VPIPYLDNAQHEGYNQEVEGCGEVETQTMQHHLAHIADTIRMPIAAKKHEGYLGNDKDHEGP
jgi:hypothetical protein